MPLFTVSLDTAAGELDTETFEIAKPDASGELTEAVMKFISDKILAPGDTISIKCLDTESLLWERPTSGTEDDAPIF